MKNLCYDSNVGALFAAGHCICISKQRLDETSLLSGQWRVSRRSLMKNNALLISHSFLHNREDVELSDGRQLRESRFTFHFHWEPLEENYWSKTFHIFKGNFNHLISYFMGLK